MAHVNPVPFIQEAPQPLLREIPPGEAYPVHALGALKEAVEAVQGQTQAPIAIPASSALAIASLIVQGFADVQTLGGVRPLSLYAMTIAQSGQRKSSCDEPFMKPLREHVRELHKAHAKKMQTYKNELSIWKVRQTAILAGMKGGKGKTSIATQADLDALGAEPKAPLLPDRTTTEPTLEGIFRLFTLSQPSAGIFSDEGGQFLGGHAMSSEHRQKTLAGLNDLWQGNPIVRTRSGDGHSVLYGRRMAIHLQVQPGVAFDFMADPKTVDTGFLPRFLISNPKSTIGNRIHSTARYNQPALDSYSDKVLAILNKPMPIDGETGELKPRVLPLDADAKTLLIQFSDSVELKQAPGGEFAQVTGYASKAAEQAARIAGVLTLFEDLDAPCVTKEMMYYGITLAEYYLSEVLRLQSVASVSVETDQAEQLRQWLLNTWKFDDIVPSEATQYGPSCVREAKKTRAAIALLQSYGWLIPLDKGTFIRGATRKEAFRIVKG
jgi:hypothetical protein